MPQQPTRSKSEHAHWRLAYTYVKRWQQRLGLQRWRVFLVFEDDTDAPKMRGVCGEIQIVFEQEYAVITLHKRLRPQWYEKVVVHELLHLRWRLVEEVLEEIPSPAGPPVFQEHHAAIQRLSRVLTNCETTYPSDGSEKADRPPW